MKRDKKGFTLIEVLIVVIILGILATIAIPQFGSIVEKSRRGEAYMTLGSIYVAQQIYYMENASAYAPDLSTLQTGTGVSITNNMFTYTASASQATATRGGNTIIKRYNDGKIQGSANNPWGVCTNWS